MRCSGICMPHPFSFTVSLKMTAATEMPLNFQFPPYIEVGCTGTYLYSHSFTYKIVGILMQTAPNAD